MPLHCNEYKSESERRDGGVASDDENTRDEEQTNDGENDEERSHE